jgi:hypothetical protein
VPVCGADGNQYDNACLAKAAGVEEFSEGECLATAGVCKLIMAPVCGKDGKQYDNDCFANAAGTEIDYEGTCK